MAVTWSQVQQNPQFQALPADQKEAARQQYFATVIAPQVGADNVEAAKAQFDAQTGPKQDAEPPSAARGASNILSGVSDLATTGVKALPAAMVNGAMDIVGRLTGSGPTKPGEGFPTPELGQDGQDLLRTVGQLPLIKQTHDWLASKFGQLPQTAQDVVKNTGQVANDVLPMGGAAATAGEAGDLAASISNPAISAGTKASDWYQAGLRNGEGHPIAKQLSGNGQLVLKNHNADVGGVVAASEAGHALDQPISYDSLADSRAEPNSVYNRLAGAFPEGVDLAADNQTRADIASAGSSGRITNGSPVAQPQIAALKNQLLDPNQSITGNQLITEMRGLRQDGFANAADTDVDKQTLGKAQLDLATALEDHVARNLPAGGDVSLAQFQGARTALAKNYAVQGALRGNDVDLSALGQIHRNNPNQLTGGLKTLAEFAEGPGRDVVGVPDRFNAPDTASDIAGIVNLHRPVASTVEGIPPVGSVARRLLTGGTGNGMADAAAAFPGRDPDAFRPLPGLTPPPGSVAPDRPTQLSLGDLVQGDPDKRRFSTSPPDNLSGPPQGGQGGIPLADVLSHGVEQPGAPGLSAGPMGAPAAGGIPFHAPPEAFGSQHLALGDLLDLGQHEPTGDVPGVMSQGVPEDIAARTPPQSGIVHQADDQTGQHVVTSPNGRSEAQESQGILKEIRSDTAPAAQGSGEGVARTEALIQQAEARGLRYGSDVSVSPPQQRVYSALERKGYRVIKNPNATVNPTTGNLVSDDPRKPVFLVKSQLHQALGDLVAQ